MQSRVDQRCKQAVRGALSQQDFPRDLGEAHLATARQHRENPCRTFDSPDACRHLAPPLMSWYHISEQMIR